MPACNKLMRTLHCLSATDHAVTISDGHVQFSVLQLPGRLQARNMLQVIVDLDYTIWPCYWYVDMDRT
jgi:hypothetical protein